MDATETTQDRPICRNCGHENISGAAFCAQCGRSLNGDEPAVMPNPPDDDTQVTSVYAPVGASVAAPNRSPWAPPVDGSTADAAGTTSALPIEERYTYADPELAPEVVARPEHRESIRGFILGVIAVLLIAVVLGLYVYATWLGDSARDTIDGWLPWLI